MRLSEVLRGLGRVVAYFPGLAKCLGWVKAAVLFCQLFYCSQRTGGSTWFPKSQQELCDETGLTIEEQRAARKQLAQKGVVQTKYNRLEHRLYFRLDLQRLDELWGTHNGHVGNSQMAGGKMPDGDAGKVDLDRSGSKISEENRQMSESNGHLNSMTGPEKKARSEAEEESSVTPEELVEGWNEHCVPLGLPEVTELSRDRRKAAIARIREHPHPSWWNRVLGKIEGSRLLTGQCKPADSYDRPFRVDFDQLLKGDFALKIYEGKYDG
jgi:hypothetical protein